VHLQGFDCEVDDENNRVSLSCVAHRIQAKVKLLGLCLVFDLELRWALCPMGL